MFLCNSQGTNNFISLIAWTKVENYLAIGAANTLRVLYGLLGQISAFDWNDYILNSGRAE